MLFGGARGLKVGDKVVVGWLGCEGERKGRR